MKIYLDNAGKSETIGIGILLTVCILSPIIIYLVKNAVGTIQVSFYFQLNLNFAYQNTPDRTLRQKPIT